MGGLSLPWTEASQSMLAPVLSTVAPCDSSTTAILATTPRIEACSSAWEVPTRTSRASTWTLPDSFYCSDEGAALDWIGGPMVNSVSSPSEDGLALKRCHDHEFQISTESVVPQHWRYNYMESGHNKLTFNHSELEVSHLGA